MMKNAVANSECSISSIVTAVEQIALAVQEISNETQTSTNLVNETVSRTQESERQVLSLLETTQSIGQVLSLIDSVAAKINMLALNATIEAARAGEAGKGFAVVAGEVKTLAKQTSQATTTIKETITNVQAISEQVIHSLHSLSEAVTRVNDSCHSIASATEEQTVILSEMATQAGHVSQEFSERDQTRLIEMAQTLVQLIVRNLYERTADVRWWATDKAFTTLMGRLNDATAKLKKDVEESKRRSGLGGLFSRNASESKPAGSNTDEKHELLEYAKDRLAIINRFYSVYLDLVLADRSGKIVACSNPGKFPRVTGADVSATNWFRKAIRTTGGDEYIADDIYRDAIHDNRAVAVYATAVRDGGELNGAPIGVLGVYFDWREQARVIVEDEPSLTPEEWRKSRVLLLDGALRIIADSERKDELKPFDLKHNGRAKGAYQADDGSTVAFAKTIGYQEFDGQGWYGVVVTQP